MMHSGHKSCTLIQNFTMRCVIDHTSAKIFMESPAYLFIESSSLELMQGSVCANLLVYIKVI